LVVSIASGKGGTGKTLFSVNLFNKLKEKNHNPTLLDLDVEEPNCDYLLDISIDKEDRVNITFPVIDDDKCKLCKSCYRVCNFNAVVVLPNRIYISESLCHSCERCIYNCMYNAIDKKEVHIGDLSYAYYSGSDDLMFCKGTLKEGRIQSKEMISKVKKYAKGKMGKNNLIIQDCPPGVSCNMTEAVKGSDIVVLVTEPTPFGLHDLELAVETVRKMNIKFYILINKSDDNDYIIEDYCSKEKVNIIGKIPYSEEIYSLYAQGMSSNSIIWFNDNMEKITETLLLSKSEV
jgi:MinD superfamily P-loop ATPase